MCRSGRKLLILPFFSLIVLLFTLWRPPIVLIFLLIPPSLPPSQIVILHLRAVFFGCSHIVKEVFCRRWSRKNTCLTREIAREISSNSTASSPSGISADMPVYFFTNLCMPSKNDGNTEVYAHMLVYIRKKFLNKRKHHNKH